MEVVINLLNSYHSLYETIPFPLLEGLLILVLVGLLTWRLIIRFKKTPDDHSLPEQVAIADHPEPIVEHDVKPEIDKTKTPPPASQLAYELPEKDTDVLPAEEIKKTDLLEPAGFFKHLKNGMSKTRKTFTSRLDKILTSNRTIDDELLEEIEELLITSDIGVKTTMDLMEKISKKSSILSDAAMLKAALKEEILSVIGIPQTLNKMTAQPHVIMIVGVNGVGKTTTIGKLAARFSKEGKKVLIAAADTFRAAAMEQLTIWAERANADIVKHKENSDPAAVAFDGIEAAMARGADVVLVDTAGRLHTKTNLMEELKKIKRAISKKLPDAPHETLMILDATTGQNALSQAKLFHEALGITGIAMAKLDGTAKGGVVISVCDMLNVPLQYIGIGEKIEDLQDFDPTQFVEALF